MGAGSMRAKARLIRKTPKVCDGRVGPAEPHASPRASLSKPEAWANEHLPLLLALLLSVLVLIVVEIAGPPEREHKWRMPQGEGFSDRFWTNKP